MHLAVEQEREKALDLSALEGLIAAKRGHAQQTSSLSSSAGRLMVLCAVPWVVAGALAVRGVRYYEILPPGEELRGTILSVCLAVGFIASLLALVVFARHWGRRVVAGHTGLKIHRASRVREYRWEDIAVSFPRGQQGLRSLTILTPDGHSTVHELLYPNFGETYKVMSQYVASARDGRH
jgi:hypothetical protein